MENNAGEKLQKRKLEINDNKKELTKITENKTIIDWTKECAKDKKESREKLARLNYIRICKKMHLPYKLSRIDGLSKPLEKRDTLERSCMW